MRFPLVGLALLAAFRAAVGQAYGPGSGPTHRVQLFVEDFTQPDSIPVLGKLGAFTADLLRLDLLQVSIADVKRTSRAPACGGVLSRDRKSTRLNSSHGYISYAVFCLKKKN